MENINNTIIPETPIQPIETPITPEPISTPPKSNLFKYLFIISIVVLLIVIISFILILNNKNTNQPPIQQDTNNISQITPTIAPTKIINEVTPINTNPKISAYSKSQNGVNNLILNKDGKEIIIDSLTKDKNDSSLDDKSIRFEDIKFSSSFRYLTYSAIHASVGSFKIYDIQNNLFVDSFENGASFTITNDEKYLIYCRIGGYGSTEGQIISLPDSNVKFDFVKYLGNKIVSLNVDCVYNSTTNVVTFNYFKDDTDSTKASINYNLNTNSIE